MDKITERILKKINQPDLIDKLDGLSLSDLNSLLLAIQKQRTAKLSQTNILKSYRSNRFVKPSMIDPVAYYKLKTEISENAKEHGIEPMLLSPVAPLGSCSAFGCVDQNNVLSAVRGCEVLSDTSNMLAVLLADRISKGEIKTKNCVHMCSVDRVSRAQLFSGEMSYAHFGVFCIVSSGKDIGSYQTESMLLMKQIAFYKNFFKSVYGADLEIALRKRSGYKDVDGFFDKMSQLFYDELPEISTVIDESDSDNHYYKGLNFKMYLHIRDKKIEVGDGGFTDWIQKMLNNKKERCLISGVGIDRLLVVKDEMSALSDSQRNPNKRGMK